MLIKRPLKKGDYKKQEINSRIWIRNSSEYSFAYNIIINNIKHLSREDALLFLDYAKRTIALDIAGAFQAAAFYLDDVDPTKLRRILPTGFITSSGEKINLLGGTDPAELVTVDISKTIIVTAPWKMERIPPVLSKIKHEGFRYHDNNHEAIYYDDIDICVIMNGYHSTAAGKYFGSGELKAQLYQTKLAYPHLTTDGEYWYSDGERMEPSDHNPCEVKDFRFALLYEISRLIDEKKKEDKPS